ncbi:hypothetical protein A7K94_0200815, partial [Modestobacter sp. VKM Ac-2676]
MGVASPVSVTTTQAAMSVRSRPCRGCSRRTTSSRRAALSWLAASPRSSIAATTSWAPFIARRQAALTSTSAVSPRGRRLRQRDVGIRTGDDGGSARDR